MAFIAVPAAAEEISTYGYCPLSYPSEKLSAQGTGKNGYIETAICLDPVSDPVFASLKGHKISGVRCYLRSDYKYKSKGTSGVSLRKGSLDAEPVREAANLSEGWNDVMFSEPVEIGDEPIYVGVRVYELSSKPYPMVSASGASVEGGYYMRVGSEGWEELKKSGISLVQAIIDTQPKDMPAGAIANLYNFPNVVEPESHFSCSLYFHNLSGEEVKEATIEIGADGGTVIFPVDVAFDEPVMPFDSREITVSVPTGSELGTDVTYTVTVISTDGRDLGKMPVNSVNLHVTNDAFVRIPLIEEFTSMFCQNCPFMTYYLDKAMEETKYPHVFISRHSGFMDDAFTNDTDREMEYLFGGSTYNPAVMYDRFVDSEVGGTPVKGANVADTAPYLEEIEKAALKAASAKILVDADFAGDKVSVTVRGKLASNVSAEGLYLSTCIVENGIPLANYPQMGLDPVPEGAPEDLVENYRHNGVVRHIFNKEPMGDSFSIDDSGQFRIDYEIADIDSKWNRENLEVISFISRVNKENLADNYVLNAGGNKWNSIVDTSGIDMPTAERPRLIVGVDSSRMLVTGENCTDVAVYSIDGQKLNIYEPLPKGVCVVTALVNGHKTEAKLIVR